MGVKANLSFGKTIFHYFSFIKEISQNQIWTKTNFGMLIKAAIVVNSLDQQKSKDLNLNLERIMKICKCYDNILLVYIALNVFLNIKLNHATACCIIMIVSSNSKSMYFTIGFICIHEISLQ